MQEAWRTYLGLATGLGETSRKQVRKVVKEAVGKGNATADQVKSMTSDLLAANAANREALAKLVRFEVDRTLGKVGLATVDEVRELTDRVHQLERELREARAVAASGTTHDDSAATAAGRAARKASPAKESPRKESPRKESARKASARRLAVSRTAAAAAEPAPAKRTAAAKATAKRTAAAKAPAKKAATAKTTAKAATRRAGGGKAATAKTTAAEAPAKKATAKAAPARKATTSKATARKAAKAAKAQP